MADRTAQLESAVEQLQQAVLLLTRRVDALEARGPGATAAAGDAPLAGAAAQPPAARARTKDPYDPIAMLSLVGRLLLVLAGGFFLRAMTDAGVLADPVGIALAFTYATVWLFMSHRAGARGHVSSAVFHALAAALVAFPLVVEATTRFKVLPAQASAAIVALVSAGLLFVAWRQRLRAVNWIAVLGALPACGALLIQTGVVVPFAVVLMAVGLGTLWLSYDTDWWGSRWPAALAANAVVAGVTLRAFAPEHRDAPSMALLLQSMLLLGYFGSTAWHTLVRGRAVSRFEMVQTAAALAVSLGGAVTMARGAGGVPIALGAAAVVLGGACYALAVNWIARRADSVLNFYFYSSVALVLVLAGFIIAVDAPWAAAVFALLAVLATFLWSRSGRLFELLHGAIYLVAAGVLSGSFGYGLRALVAGIEGGWTMPDIAVFTVVVGSVLSAALIAAGQTASDSEIVIGTRLAVCVACAWIVCGSVIGTLVPWVAVAADGRVDPGALATVRTAVLSLATLMVAWMGRQARFREWGWLVYPLLVGIGLKLLTQDFKHSRPATLFIALAVYGLALIVAPRLRRRADKSVAAVAE